MADAQNSTIEHPAVEAQVFRSVGEDGVVEFNDYGVGDPVLVEPPALVRSVDAAIVQERQHEILEVAQILAAERSEREAERLQALENKRERRNAELAQQERQELAAFRAAEAAYYPARQPIYSPYFRKGHSGFRRKPGVPRYVYAPGPDHQSRARGSRRPGRSEERREEQPIAPPRPAPIVDLIQ